MTHTACQIAAPSMGRFVAMAGKSPTWFRFGKPKDGVVALDIVGEIGPESDQFEQQLQALGELTLINMNIDSPGGDLVGASKVFAVLDQHPAKVVARILALAASAATVIAMGADEVHIAKSALFMVHNPAVDGASGQAKDLRRTADSLDKARDAMVAAYGSKVALKADELKALLEAETWMTGEEAVAAGFADQIIESSKSAPKAKASVIKALGFKNLPQALDVEEDEKPKDPPADEEPTLASVSAGLAALGETLKAILAAVVGADDAEKPDGKPADLPKPDEEDPAAKATLTKRIAAIGRLAKNDDRETEFNDAIEAGADIDTLRARFLTPKGDEISNAAITKPQLGKGAVKSLAPAVDYYASFNNTADAKE